MKKGFVPIFDDDLPKDKVRYFTKDTLIEARNAAIREKRNRVLSQEHIDNLIDDIPYVVIKYHYHRKDEIRLEIYFCEYIDYLDVSRVRFEAIQIGTIAEDKSIIPEDPKITEAKRPYAGGREWQEKVQRQPVRNQYSFRKEVLRAYSCKCAVCLVSNPKFLDAAHILPAAMGDDDSVNNGICLCKNHHIAFDNGILKISPDGDVVVVEDSGIKVEFTKIRYPKNNEDYPLEDNLKLRYHNFKK